MSDAEARLREMEETLVRQFLAITTGLERLDEQSNELATQSEQLATLALGQQSDGEFLSSISRQIEEPIRFLTQAHQATREVLERLHGHAGQIERLLQVEPELHRAMAPLPYLRTLFRVESTALNPELQQIFAALTQEIRSLHTGICNLFGAQFQQLTQTRRTLNGVIRHLETQVELFQRTATQQTMMETSFSRLQAELRANKERGVRLRALSQSMARKVEQIGTGLRIQDSVRPKLTAIRAAILRIHAKRTELEAAPINQVATELLPYLHQSCRLETEQLWAVGEDLTHTEEQIQSGIRQVLQQVGEVNSLGLSSQESGVLATSWDGLVQALPEAIEEVRHLVRVTATCATQAHELLRPLGGKASDLTTLVRDLSVSIHLLGLNAQVQAAQVGQGGTLEVLSARTSEVSRETSRFSEAAASQLDSLEAGLAESVNALARLHAQGVAQQAVLDQPGRQSEEQLRAFRDGTLATLAAIDHSLTAIRTQAELTLQSAQFAVASRDLIASAQTPLRTVAELAKGCLETGPGTPTKLDLVEDLQRD